MKEKLKKLTAGLFAFMMVLTLSQGGTAKAASNLKDGNYTIGVKAINTSNGETSNADSAIKKPVKLEVKGGKIFVIAEMDSAMEDLGVKGSGKATVVSKTSKTATYKFQVSSIDQPVVVETVIAVMGKKVEFKIAFDKGSLKEVASSSSSSSTKDNAKADSNKTESTNKADKGASTETVSNPKTGDNSLTSVYGVVAGAAILSVILFRVNKSREKALADK